MDLEEEHRLCPVVTSLGSLRYLLFGLGEDSTIAAVFIPATSPVYMAVTWPPLAWSHPSFPVTCGMGRTTTGVLPFEMREEMERLFEDPRLASCWAKNETHIFPDP